jgi:hypothetical protein
MSADNISPKNNQDETPEKLKLKLLKSHLFRVIHVDSVWGGLSPNGDSINMNLCNQRFPIPQKLVYELEKDGSLENEINEERIQEDDVDVEWEIEVSAMMDIETAKTLIEWLKNMVKQAENDQD